MAAGLILSPGKCHLVPITARPSMHICSVLKDWLASNIPAWAGFNVSASAQFLGVHMGPSAGSVRWPSVVKKSIERARVIASGGCASVLSAWTYNSK
eukprot:11952411-Karenia_brevis.AAC.1